MDEPSEPRSAAISPPLRLRHGRARSPRAPHVERIRAASASAFAPATRRAYGGSWAQFLAWADGEGLQALPAPPAAAAYLAHRSEDGRSLATLRMDRQAIRAAHIEAGEADPTTTEGVRRVLQGLLLPSPRRGSLPPRPSPCGKLGPRRHGLSSNAERGTPDWRMIAISVPVRSSRRSGTGTVIVPSASVFCIAMWLPRRLT